MFSCNACLRRAIRSLDPYGFVTTPPSIRTFDFLLPGTHSLPQSSVSSVRSHSTVQTVRRGHHRRVLRQALRSQDLKPNRSEGKFLETVVNKRNKRAIDQNAGHLDIVDGSTKELQAREKRAAFEAQYLGDPLRLANAVLAKLQESKLDDALDLVRASEKLGDGKIRDNVVSWNYCIDWTMDKGQVNLALKIYNEMKKRGHKPDAHSYTILLRGLARNAKFPNAVDNAIKIYDSISAPNSVVTPSTIHTNAVINVCARGGKMDSLWTVAGRLPEKGAGAPDKWTFTTIINAIREDARLRAIQLACEVGQDGDTEKIFAEAVSDARQLWSDITKRWRKADIMIDEALVCAMGRLLMTSSKRSDLVNVLNLVQQTMNIERPVSSDINEETEEFKRIEDLETVGKAETTLAPDEPPGAKKSAAFVVMSNKQEPDQMSKMRESLFAKPGNNTLSMLLETCSLLKLSHVGKFYWDALTSPTGEFRVEPDAQNITAYLRVLRISRASKAAAELLTRDWPESVAKLLYRPGTFVIAMSTCVRDKNNPNVFDTATQMLDVMEQKAKLRPRDEQEEKFGVSQAGQSLDVPPRILAMYINLALATTKGVNPRRPLSKKANGDLDFERNPSANNTMRALSRAGNFVSDVQRLVKLKMDDMEDFDSWREMISKHRVGNHVDIGKVADDMEDILALITSIVSAYDKLLAVNAKLEDFGLGPLDGEYIRSCQNTRRSLSLYQRKLINGMKRRDGKEPRKQLWDGDDATKMDDPQSVGYHDATDAVDADADADEEDMSESLDEKIPATDKFQRAVKQGRRQQEWAEASRKLSRRQKQEVESLRHEGKARRRMPPANHSGTWSDTRVSLR